MSISTFIINSNDIVYYHADKENLERNTVHSSGLPSSELLGTFLAHSYPEPGSFSASELGKNLLPDLHYDRQLVAVSTELVEILLLLQLLHNMQNKGQKKQSIGEDFQDMQ